MDGGDDDDDDGLGSQSVSQSLRATYIWTGGRVNEGARILYCTRKEHQYSHVR